MDVIHEGYELKFLGKNYAKLLESLDTTTVITPKTDHNNLAENIGENLSIAEVSLPKGELYTFVTNKQGRGKKKTLVASIKGTKSEDIIDVLNLIPLEKRKLVKEITLDMANNMQLVSRISFPESALVTDLFML